MRDLRQAESYATWMESMGWKVEKILNLKFEILNYVFIRRIPLIGSVIKVQKPNEPIPFGEIKNIAQKERAIFVKVEPGVDGDMVKFKSNGYKFDKWALGVTKTIRIDLGKPQDQIFNQFKKDCRYDIRKSGHEKLELHINEFSVFYGLLKTANKIKRLWTQPENQFNNLVKSFGDNCFCIVITEEQNNNPVAGCLVLIADRTAYYFLAGSLPKGKNMHAHSRVVWEAIKEAKKRGCTEWDFEGIYDSRYTATNNWKGFTHFKQSFGGMEITFPGSFTWYRNPLLKLLSPFMI